LGHRPLAQMKTLYNSKCAAAVLYGAGVWGYNKIPSLQSAENKFLRRLLTVPKCVANIISHEEIGQRFLEDRVSIAPLLLWIRCWLNPAAKLVQDCTSD
ncbi:hypothetical protein NDU88_004265, partial [Pleurodeles waltl]